MKLHWFDEAWFDYVDWQTQDKKKLKKINILIKEIMRTPFEGSGNPEPLKHELSGFWSRRIDSEHRLVYRVTDEAVEILSCKLHYK